MFLLQKKNLFIVIFLITAVSIISMNVTSQNASELSLPINEDFRLVGSWKLMSGVVTSPNGDVVTKFTDKEKRMIKVFSKTNVVFVRSDVASNTLEVAGSANYILEGNTLTKLTNQHSANFLVGEKYQLEVTFPDENTWKLKGKVGANTFEEEYIRID